MSKTPITVHVLDSSIGKPAEGVDILVQALSADASESKTYATGRTDGDGRCMQLSGAGQLQAGIYKATFRTKEYFERTGHKCFYPWVEITFEVSAPTDHYHIPLLISPYSYTTYRGS